MAGVCDGGWDEEATEDWVMREGQLYYLRGRTCGWCEMAGLFTEGALSDEIVEWTLRAIFFN